MNERIKELAVQAKVEHCVSHVRLQEFAELIVKECVLQCHHNDDMDRIEKHFGVEE